MEDSIFFSTQLRTKRARKRSVKTTKEKNVREKYKRRKEIFKEQKAISLVPLKEPYQKGFERYFVLREDIKKENEIEFFTQFLKKINTSQYAETRKFVKKRKRNGKRIYVQRIQELKQLQPYEYSGPYSILNDEERRYFACIQVYDPKTKRFKGIYEFLQPWRFRLIIKPNMITHYKPLDIDLKREEAQIDHFFDKYKNQGILLKKIVGGGYSYERKPKFKNPFTKRKFFNNKNSATEIAEMLIEQEHQLSKRH